MGARVFLGWQALETLWSNNPHAPSPAPEVAAVLVTGTGRALHGQSMAGETECKRWAISQQPEERAALHELDTGVHRLQKMSGAKR